MRLVGQISPATPAARCVCVSVYAHLCVLPHTHQWRDQAYPLWQSLLCPFWNWVVQFTTFVPLHTRPPPIPNCGTHTRTWSRTHFSDRLLDKPLTFTLQSLRSISRPFFHVMFTSLWAIWPQWGDCLWSTTCVYNGHFPCFGSRGEAIKAAQPCVSSPTYWKEWDIGVTGTHQSDF